MTPPRRSYVVAKPGCVERLIGYGTMAKHFKGLIYACRMAPRRHVEGVLWATDCDLDGQYPIGNQVERGVSGAVLGGVK